MNNTENNQPTRLTEEAHNGQTAANTNKTRIIRNMSEFRQALVEQLAQPSVNTFCGHRRCPKPPVCSYSRKRALAEGHQVQVAPEFIKKMNEEWDFIFDSPMFMTRKAVEVCEIASGRGLYTESGPLWAILCVLDSAIDCPLIGRGSPMVTRIPFDVNFRTNRTAPLVWLNLAWSTADIDDPRPSVTIMLPEED